MLLKISQTSQKKAPVLEFFFIKLEVWRTENLTQVFSIEICHFFKKNYFDENKRTVAFDLFLSLNKFSKSVPCVHYSISILFSCNQKSLYEHVSASHICKHFLPIFVRTLQNKVRSSRPEVFCKKDVLKTCVRYFHQIFIFSPNDSPSKTMKNAFYFI